MVYKAIAHSHSSMSDTEEPVLNELNQILKLQDIVRKDYQGIVDSENSAVSQALLNSLVVRFMDLNLKATALIAAAAHPPYDDNNNNHQTINIIADADDTTVVETVEVITRSLSASKEEEGVELEAKA